MDVEAPPTAFEEQFEKGKNIQDVNPTGAIEIFQKIISTPIPEDYSEVQEEDSLKAKEQAIYALGSVYAKLKRVKELGSLIVDIRPFFETVSKAKTSKIVKTLIDQVGQIENTIDIQIGLCKESVTWSTNEKRTFLRQRIQAKLAALYLESKQFPIALKLISKLLLEVKKLDDKQLLVELHLLESRIQFALQNLPKAKAALTACRAAANVVYVAPLLQAEIDLQGGKITSSEKDFKTAFSYFYEAFEGFDGVQDPRAATGLKYMVLCKIMAGKSRDVKAIITNKLALKYSGPQVEAMRAVATAADERSIKELKAVREGPHRAELVSDPIVERHLDDLYNDIMHMNLLKIIEPYSRVQISHVAKQIELSEELVQQTIAKLILDQMFNGILLPETIIAYPEPEEDKVFAHAIETVNTLDSVVTRLFDKAETLR